MFFFFFGGGGGEGSLGWTKAPAVKSYKACQVSVWDFPKIKGV